MRSSLKVGTKACAVSLEFIGGFESTYVPAFDMDGLETTGHAVRWRQDLSLMRSCGVTRLRYPIRWHRIEREAGTYDWAGTDEVLGHLLEEGFFPIVDLVHHISHPGWLDAGFADPRFGSSYLRFAEAFAHRYPWVPAYTLLNEPFVTLFMAGHEAIWPPYRRGMQSFVRVLQNALPAFFSASRMYRELLPAARHVYVDGCESHSAGDLALAPYAEIRSDRRFFLLDLMLGRVLDPERPFAREVVEAGGADLLELEPGHIDVLGLDYYPHCEWHYVNGGGLSPSPEPRGFASLALEYWERYGLPVIVGETNIRGFASDRASWLKYMLEQCERAQEAGVPFEGFCWFPFIDSCDWDSLLARADGHIDPVGVYWLDHDLERHASTMSRSYAVGASGAPSSALPAYRFRWPVSEWLEGFMPQMSHWDWQEPPEEESSLELDLVLPVGR